VGVINTGETEVIDSDMYVDASIDPAHVASGAWDFGTSVEADTLTEGGVGIPNLNETDWVGSAEMADEDHGMTSWTSGVATVEDFALNADADAGDFDIQSVDKLEGVDAQVYVDLGADGVVEIQSDTTVQIGASDENLQITDGGANQINIGSGSGVDTISLGAISVSTTGIIKGRAEYGADITGATAHDTTELHGVFYHFTAAATVTLDAAADAGYGAQACYRIRDAAEAAVIDVQAGEKINLAGTALAAGTAITAAGAGESVCMVATTDTDGSGTDGWEAWGPTSEWASE
jgi:hypothetical protein